MSALNGDMVVERGDKLDWYQGPTLMDLLENVPIDHDINLEDFRFPDTIGVPAANRGVA